MTMKRFENDWTEEIERLRTENAELKESVLFWKRETKLSDAHGEKAEAETERLKAEVERLRIDLQVNATILARQCDMARDAEREALEAKREIERLKK
jgi:hypothetical protein